MTMYRTSSLTEATGNAWVKLMRSSAPASNNSGRVRLFSFPHAGAGASVFHDWKDLLPDFIEFYPVQLPGREDRIIETPYTHMPDLIPDLVDALHPYLDRPFAFFGHSLGAVISYELALALRQMQGMLPIHIFVSGHIAPHISDSRPPIYKLPKAAFVDKLKLFNGISAEVFANQELMELLLPTIRADFTLSETYAYQTDKPLNCPISAYGGLQDPYVSRQDLEAWQDHTTATFTVRLFPGDHFYLLSEEKLLVRTVASDLHRYVQSGKEIL